MPLTHRIAALTTVALITLGGSLSGSAYADDPDPSGAPPGSTTTSPPPDVDANSPGLKLADGATLAPPRCSTSSPSWRTCRATSGARTPTRT